MATNRDSSSDSPDCETSRSYPQSPAQKVQDRYGRRPQNSGAARRFGRQTWLKHTLWAVPLVAFLVFSAIWVQNEFRQRVQADMVKFELGGESGPAEVTLRITKPPQATVVCGVRVMNLRHEDVGYGEYRIEPGQSQQFITLTIPTMERAVGAAVHECAPLP